MGAARWRCRILSLRRQFAVANGGDGGAEAHQPKRAGPLVAIDHRHRQVQKPSVRAAPNNIGPSLEKPTGALPTAVAGGHARAGATAGDGQQGEIFGSPRYGQVKRAR